MWLGSLIAGVKNIWTFVTILALSTPFTFISLLKYRVPRSIQSF